MTLPNETVRKELERWFVLSWRNIERESHVGRSHGYGAHQTAVATTNGAGGRNVQLVTLAADRTVLHVLPGYWHPDDLVAELRFAREVHRLYVDDEASDAQKHAMFTALHRAASRRTSADTIARSDWQGFDRVEELQRAQREPRDTVTTPGTLKPVCLVVRDRMAARPFRKLDAFDMETFVDYGRPFYDNNAGLDKGKRFTKADAANEKREAERAKEEAERREAEEKAEKESARGAVTKRRSQES